MSPAPVNSIEIGGLSIVGRKISIVEAVPVAPGTLVGSGDHFEPAIALGYLKPARPPCPGRFCAIVADPNDRNSFSVRVIDTDGSGGYSLLKVADPKSP